MIDVGWAMQRDETVSGFTVKQCRVGAASCKRIGWRTGELAILEQGVDHDVADEADTLGGDAFAQQIGFRAALGRIEQIGDLIAFFQWGTFDAGDRDGIALLFFTFLQHWPELTLR